MTKLSRLKEMYDSEVKAGMMKKFGYKNEMQIPKLVKIVVNMVMRKTIVNY